MALELFPTPSCPRPAFSIPFSAELKRFPNDDEMTARPLTVIDSGTGLEITSFWACDYDNLYLGVEVLGSVDTSSAKVGRHRGEGLLLAVSSKSDDEPVPCQTSLWLAGTTKKPQIIAINRGSTWFPQLDCAKVKYRLQQDKGKARFSIVFPWSVLAPLRPLLYETIAINLTFVHRIGQESTGYQLIPDSNFANEVSNLRRLLPVKICCENLSRPLAQSYLIRNCWRGGEPLQINLGLFNPETGPARLDLSIKDGANTLEVHSSSVQLAPGCHHWTLRWSPQRPFSTGKYILELCGQGFGKSYTKQHNIYFLNPQDLAVLRSDLLNYEENISCLHPGAVQTALAKLEWLEEALDSCAWEEPDLSSFADAQHFRDSLRNGINPIPDGPGLSRRAFRSQVDDSLQTYSLYLPKGYTTEHKLPLLILLHGHGGDEQKLAANPELHKLADKLGLVLLYPKARSNHGLYRDHDEIEVLRNLAILKKRLALDWDRLFLGGISLGGFGAWHIGLRHPEHFAGLAIVSDIPCLPIAEDDLGLDYSLSPAAYVENAKKLSILVVHGAKNCVVPPESVRDAVKLLRENGVDIVYKEHANDSHGNYDWCSDLASWIKVLLKK